MNTFTLQREVMSESLSMYVTDEVVGGMKDTRSDLFEVCAFGGDFNSTDQTFSVLEMIFEKFISSPKSSTCG
jgi:hypothetical protein